MTDWRSPANYHLPSDIPANLDYRSVGRAVTLVHDLVASLAARATGHIAGETVAPLPS
jgi:hypothetical protein